MKQIVLPLATLCLLASCNEGEKNQANLTYPETKQVDTVDTYFDTEVKDPYRWLEDDRSAETEEWVKAQNDVTFDYLESIPYRNKLKRAFV